MINRPGLKTTEFWITVVSQLLAMLAMIGVVNSADAATLQDAIVKCVTAGGVFLANAWIVVRYIQGRVNLKQFRG